MMMIRMFLLSTVVSLHTTHAALQNNCKGSTPYPSPTLQLNQTSDFFSKVKKNQIKEIQKLLESGIDPNQEDRHHQTALHLAQTPEMVELLISFGANPNKVDRSGYTPLYRTNKLTTIQALLKAGALPGKTTLSGSTALHRVAEVKGGATLVKPFIDGGAQINHQENDNNTALHCAVGYFFLGLYRTEESFNRYPRPQEVLGIIQTLIQNGASLTIKNNEGETPFDLANAKITDNPAYLTHDNKTNNPPLINKALALLNP